LNNGLPKVHLLIPGTCEYVTFNGKRDCVIKVKGLRWGDYLRLLGWTQYNHSHGGPYKKEAESEKKKGTEAGVRKGRRCYTTGFGEGGRGQEPRKAGSL